MIHPTRTTQTRKRAVSLKQRQNKEKKNNTTKEWKWRNKEKSMTKKECTLSQKYSSILIIAQHTLTYFNGYRNESTSRNHCIGKK